jgi:hypothetical protein
MNVRPRAAAIALCTAGALLSACQPSPATVPAPGLSTAAPGLGAPMREHRGSWMSPDASTHDLLYVSSDDENAVYALSYPDGKLMGELVGFFNPRGICVDRHGDVYIANFEGQDILEYAHGRKIPKANLNDNGYGPYGCSVDPTTGDLAVTNYCAGTPYTYGCEHKYNNPNLLIYKKGRGTPKAYTLPAMYRYVACSYDSSGNLYVDGIGANGYSPVQFAELPAGGSALKTITLNETMSGAGGVQWDGHYIDVENDAPDNQVIYAFAVRKGIGKKARSTPLDGVGNIGQFWIDGSHVIVAAEELVYKGSYGYKVYPVASFNYPKGGKQTSEILGYYYVWGVAISPAKTP